MDVKKIGQFLSQLRRDKGMTQEQLGEMLGVTNKTVSRWENGNYLPPVEMLQSLSDLYGITINEILSAERLTASEYQHKAEENIKSALQSSFSLKEKIDFYKKKWRKDHLSDYIACSVFVMALYLAGALWVKGLQLVGYAVCMGFVIVKNNQMMAYVEDRAFDGSGLQ